jgi:hypothetical protein
VVPVWGAGREMPFAVVAFDLDLGTGGRGRRGILPAKGLGRGLSEGDGEEDNAAVEDAFFSEF